MASEAPRTLPCCPSLTANLLGSGASNPCGGLNSGGGSGAEVATVSGWALTATREVALARRRRHWRRRGGAGGGEAPREARQPVPGIAYALERDGD